MIQSGHVDQRPNNYPAGPAFAANCCGQRRRSSSNNIASITAEMAVRPETPILELLHVCRLNSICHACTPPTTLWRNPRYGLLAA